MEQAYKANTKCCVGSNSFLVVPSSSSILGHTFRLAIPDLLDLVSRLAGIIHLTQDEGRNQTVQSQVAGEDLDEDGTDEERVAAAGGLSAGVAGEAHLLPRGRHGRLGAYCPCSGIGGNADGKAGGQRGETAAKAGGEVSEAIVLAVSREARSAFGFHHFTIENYTYTGDRSEARAQLVEGGGRVIS